MKKEEIERTYFESGPYDENPLGFWYRSLENLGESVVFNYGQLSGNKMEWTYYKHEDYDGVSSIQHFLNDKFKEKIKAPTLDSKFRAPGFFTGIIGAIRYQLKRELPFFTWKRRDFSKGLTFKSKEKKYITLSFSEEETKQLFKHLKTKKVNFNCLSMIMINNFIADNFIETHRGKFLWMLPVNMRSQIKAIGLGNNQSSYLDLVINENETPESLRQKMIHKMIKREHWFVWYGARLIPKFFSKGAFKTIKSHLLNGGPPYVGNFSNLGRFYLEKDIKSPIYLGTNVTRVRPIGVGLLSVNDQLTITLQFHETLGLTDKSLEKIDEDFQLLKRKFFSL